jgi:hypothetical protein
MATAFPGSYTPGFFLMGFVEDRVFIPRLRANFAELRTRITAAVAEVTPEILRSVWQDIGYRWDVCNITNGSHINPQISEVERVVFCHIMTFKNTVHVL